MKIELKIPLKFPRAFQELLKPYRYKVFYGGRGAGKSRSFAKALLIEGTKQTERILCCREIQRSINDSVKRLLEDEIARLNLNQFYRSTQNLIEGINGTMFIFAGLKTNIDSIKSMEGITKAWCEEAQSLSQESLDILIPTIRNKNSEIWFSFNAKNKTDPVYKKFVLNEPPPDSLVKKVNHNDNPYFPEILKKEMEWDKQRDYEKYKHIWEGFPVQYSEEQVFCGKWRVDKIPELPRDTKFYFGADWEFSQDPTTLVRFWIQDNNLYIDHEAYGVGVELDEIEQLFDSIPESRKWNIKADSSRPDTISHLRRKGFNIAGAKKGKGSIEDGITKLKNYNIVIDENCKHTINEFTLYSYKKDKVTGEILPIVVDKHNHIIDPLRYAIEDVYINKFVVF